MHRFFVLEIIKYDLHAYDGDSCGKTALPQVIEQTAVLNIDQELPDGKRDR